MWHVLVCSRNYFPFLACSWFCEPPSSSCPLSLHCLSLPPVLPRALGNKKKHRGSKIPTQSSVMGSMCAPHIRESDLSIIQTTTQQLIHPGELCTLVLSSHVGVFWICSYICITLLQDDVGALTLKAFWNWLWKGLGTMSGKLSDGFVSITAWPWGHGSGSEQSLYKGATDTVETELD